MTPPRFLATFLGHLMGPKPSLPLGGDLSRQPLVERINTKHSLVRLAEVID
jgi:hypothetical protein